MGALTPAQVETSRAPGRPVIVLVVGPSAQLIYDALREPMRRALERLVMEWQTQENPTFPPFIQQLIEGGKLEAKREALLRLMGRLRLDPTDEQRARILSCTDLATLDRWFDNAFASKTAADVLI